MYLLLVIILVLLILLKLFFLRLLILLVPCLIFLFLASLSIIWPYGSLDRRALENPRMLSNK